MACALRAKTWTLGGTIGPGQQPRERTVAARHPARVLQAIAQAKSRCGLPATAPGVRGDDAGRDGCWRQRFVPAHGMTHPVVDASAIAGNRRQRRATSDGWDVHPAHAEALGAGCTCGVARGACARGGSRGPAASAPGPGNAAGGAGQSDAPDHGRAQEPGGEVAAPDAVARATRRPAAVGWRTPAAWAAPTGTSRVGASRVFACAERGGGRGASCPAAPLTGRRNRAGPSADGPARPREQWGLVVGEGMFCLARVQAPSGGGGLSGRNPDPVSQRREGAGTRPPHVGPSAWAWDAHGAGLEWATVPAGACAAWWVSSAFWGRGQACEAPRDGGSGAAVAHAAVAMPQERGVPCGGRPERGVSGSAVLRQSAAVPLVKAARCTSGPCTDAVGEMGSPPRGLPVVVDRRREQRVTGVCTRTESRSLETRAPNATGSRQSDRGRVTQRAKHGGEKNIRERA